MQCVFIIFLLFVIMTYVYAQCLTAQAPGTWSPYVENGCSDTCGMCGVIQMIRICLVAGTCTGSPTMNSTTHCGPTLCPYPRNSCCPGFIAGVSSGSLVCLQIG